jgi:mono/diheme cytochrome c family protein
MLSRTILSCLQVQRGLGVNWLVRGLLLSIFLIGSGTLIAGDPSLPGNHPLTQAQAGSLLISELRCAACHSGIERSSHPEKTAPDLSEVGARISPAYLRRYLASPSTIHPGTTMPDILASKPEAERDKVAEALTHFLIAQSKTGFASEKPAQLNVAEGKALFHSVGCVACHGPREALSGEPPVKKRNDEEDEDESLPKKKPIQPVAVKLGHVVAKYSAKSLSEFLFQPLRVRSSGRMPDLKLTPAESLAIAGYLIGDQPPMEKALVPETTLVAAGQKYFQELNCAACHTLGNIKASPQIGPLSAADFTRGCLSKTSARSPQFNVDDAQKQAIIAALRAKPTTDSPQVVVAKTMTAFNCIACHIRDDYGGILESYNAFFQTSEKNLGDDARIPPPLTLVGAKLQPAWMKKVLFDGESVRPYMATRMPQFGTANLHHLPEIFARLDVLKSPALSIPEPEPKSTKDRDHAKLLRTAGRELLGDKALNCVNCHNFNGKPSPTNKGIDLMTSYERLQPGWFSIFIRNPGALRPRIVMPTAWPDGIATHKKILEGNTDEQIAAIWFYLSLGTSAADPSGIRVENTRLTVGAKAEVHRGRSRVAGFRGISVGLPEKLSYAFNAETGTLTAIWQGEFVNVNWQGQGSGDFNPVGEAITLAQDVSFAQLADEKTPWPLLPVMTKEAPVNPDPLFPKNHGYQFRGYFLDEQMIPTFQYRSGTIEIEDRSVASGSEGQRKLKRVLQFHAPEQQTVWFRAMTGDLKQESERVFRSGKLRLTIPEAETKLRQNADDPKRSELLLRLQIPKGKSNMEFLYEPIPK